MAVTDSLHLTVEYANAEKLLAELWEKLLGTRPQASDAFFDEGDSIRAARLAIQLRELGYDIAVGDIFRHPEFADLTGVLAEQDRGPAAEPASGEPRFADLWSDAVSPWASGGVPALVSLADGEGDPIFWTHWATGNIRFLARIADKISAGRPVYGFRHPALQRRERVQLSVTEIAERYVEELVRLRSEGPYLLGGLCNGSMIALEMARRLTEMGQEVSFLGFVNGFPPSDDSELAVTGGLEDLYNLRLATLRERFGVSDIARNSADILAKLQAEDIAYYDGDERPEDFLWFQAVWAAITFAYMHHEPRGYSGQAVVFQTRAGAEYFESLWRPLVPSAVSETYDVRSTLPILNCPDFQRSITRHLAGLG